MARVIYSELPDFINLISLLLQNCFCFLGKEFEYRPRPIIGHLWPLIVESNISEKPSVVHLQNEFCQIIIDNFQSFDIKQEVNKSVKDCAKALLMTLETPKGMLPNLSYTQLFHGPLSPDQTINIKKMVLYHQAQRDC